MATILDGKKVSNQLKDEIKKLVAELKSKTGRTPGLAVIMVGDNEASKLYVKNKEKACKQVDIESYLYYLPNDVPKEEVEYLIQMLNDDKDVSGILLQLPVPDHLDDSLIQMISPEKDVDGFNIENAGLLQLGEDGFVPCTPLGVVALLKMYQIDLKGKHAVIIGRSNLVGKPLVTLLLNENMTVTCCHSHTKNIKELCKLADVLVLATGKTDIISVDSIKEDAIVIDVGIHRDENGIRGDLYSKDKASLFEEKTSYYTPVPGGVGPMTIAMLLSNTLKAFKQSIEFEKDVREIEEWQEDEDETSTDV